MLYLGLSTCRGSLRNGRGERVMKQAQGTTLFFYDLNGQLIAETDDTGVTIKEYLYLDGIPLAMISEATGGAAPFPAGGCVRPRPG